MKDESIRTAQLWLWNEPRQAVLHSRRYAPRADETVYLAIYGTNVDPASLN